MRSVTGSNDTVRYTREFVITESVINGLTVFIISFKCMYFIKND
jgi:hypothetical protein